MGPAPQRRPPNVSRLRRHQRRRRQSPRHRLRRPSPRRKLVPNASQSRRKQRTLRPRRVRKRRRKTLLIFLGKCFLEQLRLRPIRLDQRRPQQPSRPQSSPIRQIPQCRRPNSFHSAQSLHHRSPRENCRLGCNFSCRRNSFVTLTLVRADVTLLFAHARMRAVDLIRKKRDSGENSREEINFLISGYTRGEIPDYQMSAWLMAAWLRGLSGAEIASLTEAMLHSREVITFPELPGKKVDKHSTGGVGDNNSLILASIVAAGGLHVPMISGRGLGHTGGTLDKLESIPGFNTSLTLAEFRSVLGKCGMALIGQTAEIAPADKKIYALRDATSTVENIGLICASIMSKKMAEGIDALVLDVKTSSCAFMQKEEDGVRLAEL